MTEQPPVPNVPDEGGGRLAENIMHFARVLRAAGLPIGPGRVLDAIEAVQAVGIGERDDFYWTLHAVFVNRRDQRDLFDQAFHVFWRNPKLLEPMFIASAMRRDSSLSSSIGTSIDGSIVANMRSNNFGLRQKTWKA